MRRAISRTSRASRNKAARPRGPTWSRRNSPAPSASAIWPKRRPTWRKPSWPWPCLIFQDLGQPFSVVDDLQPDGPVATPPEIRQQAVAMSPDIRAAQSSVEQAGFGIKAARAGFLPTFSLDYFYGIDARQWAVRDPEGHRNLGNVAQATVTVPVWNWGSTRSKVRQAELQRQQAELDLRFAQRQIDANTNAFYIEAQAARAQIQSLRGSADLAEESLRLTLLRYQAGEATALEVVDSQTTAADARNAYDDGLARYRLALGNIEILTGRY